LNQNLHIEEDLRVINSITAIPAILDVVCRTTGMGFATVARVSDSRWIACAVLDNVEFGLKQGGELKVETTLCNEVRQYHEAIVIDHFDQDEVYAKHHTPLMYGLQSYISIPITLKDGSFFGTLCAIDSKPAKVNNPETIGMFNLYAELIALHIDNFQKMQRAEESLVEEKNIAELREQFIAILGHDLRNPVGAIGNVAQILQKGSVDKEKLNRFVNILLNSTSRMKGLIDNLMDFARGRLGEGIVLDRKYEVLDETLWHVIQELQLIWPGKIIHADLDLEIPVYSDSKRIAQLFSNVLGNALGHGKDGHPVRVIVNSNKEKFFLSVKNMGEELSEDLKANIFEPFSRESANGKREGLGLGLFISAEIARAHGSQLEAHSSGNEIEFTLTIPN
jgi:signal transduction histidine kinase